MASNIDVSKLELGPANIYLGTNPAATLLTAGTTNSGIRVEAQFGGTAGNSITFAMLAGVSQVLGVTVVNELNVVVQLATTAAGTVTSTARDVIDLLDGSATNLTSCDTTQPGATFPVSFGLIKATAASPGDATGVIAAAFAQAPLTGGASSCLMVSVGALGDEVQISTTTEAGPLTAAQTGTVPQGKVVVGGRFQIAVPFKEITLDNYRKAFPNAIVFNDGGTDALGRVRHRLNFQVRVGLNLRNTAVRMEIRKIVGGVESTRKDDIVVIPLASPVDGEVLVPYSPTTQRVITAHYEAWPVNNVWAFMGQDPI